MDREQSFNQCKFLGLPRTRLHHLSINHERAAEATLTSDGVRQVGVGHGDQVAIVILVLPVVLGHGLDFDLRKPGRGGQARPERGTPIPKTGPTFAINQSDSGNGPEFPVRSALHLPISGY